MGHVLHKSRNNRQRRQGSRANCKTFTDGSSGVAKLIKRIGDFASFFAKTCHFSDAAGVISNRAIGINGHGDTNRREHANRSNANTIKPTKFSGGVDDGADGQYRNNHGFHANRQAGNHYGGRAGLARFGDF